MPQNRVTIPNAGEHGVIYDVDPINLPMNAWSNGRNYKVKNGSLLTVNGRQQISQQPTVQPQHLLPLQDNTAEYWLYAGYDSGGVNSELWTISSNSTHVNISPLVPLTSSLVVDWSSTNYGGFAVITNNTDAPHTWDGAAANAVALTAWPANTECRVIDAYKGFLVTGDITKSGVRFSRLVKWSDQAVPGTLPGSWDETDATVQAGEFELKGGGGAIVDMAELNDTLYIYRETAVDSMTFTGGVLVFNFKQLFNGWGVMAQNCVGTLLRKHYVFTSNDFVVHDGSTYQSIIEGKQREKIFASIDGINQNRCYVTTNNQENEVWFCYPETGETSCTKAFTFNVITGETGERDLPNLYHAAAGKRLTVAGGEWNNETQVWNDVDHVWNTNQTVGLLNQISCSQASSLIYNEDTGFTDDGADIEAWVERQDLLVPGVDPMQTITITEIIPLIETQNVISTSQSYILVANKHTLQGGLTWNPQIDFDATTDYLVKARVTGKLPSFRFYWKGKGQLKVNGYGFTYVLRGRR